MWDAGTAGSSLIYLHQSASPHKATPFFSLPAFILLPQRHYVYHFPAPLLGVYADLQTNFQDTKYCFSGPSEEVGLQAEAACAIRHFYTGCSNPLWRLNLPHHSAIPTVLFLFTTSCFIRSVFLYQK